MNYYRAMWLAALVLVAACLLALAAVSHDFPAARPGIDLEQEW